MRCDRAPVLVLGLGNLLLRDDGVGLELLAALRDDGDTAVDYVDGGTQGIALCGVIGGRRALLVLDAVQLGAEPGTVHRLDDPGRHRPARADSAHGANAGDLLAAVALLGDLPERVTMIGIEPDVIRTGIGLSDTVRRALPAAIDVARRTLGELCGAAAGGAACTS